MVILSIVSSDLLSQPGCLPLIVQGDTIGVGQKKIVQCRTEPTWEGGKGGLPTYFAYPMRDTVNPPRVPSPVLSPLYL
jgi:hypothetical protein